MERSNQDLLLTIKQQEETLNRYKNRLQDVVAAYKRLTVEKESLENGLIATIENRTNNDEAETSSVSQNKDTSNAQSRINTLAQSLADLTVEKARTESDFQAIRKKLMHQIKTQDDTINDLKMQLEEEKKVHETITENIKSEMVLEHRKQESRQMSIIRELQELVSDERKHKERKDSQIEELKDQLKKRSIEVAEHKKSIKTLRFVIDNVKSINDADNTADDKASANVLNKLKEELKVIQEQRSRAIQQEQRRIAEVEERSRLLVDTQENRVIKLEEQLTELTNLISDYDRSRQTDQEAIHKLKDRLLHLEMENINSVCEDDRTSLTREEIIGQFKHWKRMLMMNNKTPEHLNQFREYILEDLDFVEVFSHNNIEQLKDDTNRRKEEEIASLKRSVEHLKIRNAELERVNINSENENKETRMALELQLNSCREQLKNREMEYHKKLISTEEELIRETNRLTTIIAERDKYIESLKTTNDDTNLSQQNEDNEHNAKENDERSLSKLFHYVHDGARKESEICRLRQNNNELENKLHDLQKEIYIREEKYQQQIAELQDDKCRLERSINLKDEVNIEYLKNVVANYLSTVDIDKRTHMLNAIFTILHFTDKEIDRIRNYYR